MSEIKIVKRKYPVSVDGEINRIKSEMAGTDDMTAKAAIDEGKYFIVNNRLFRSLTVITAGETIRLGVNCEETSVDDVLNKKEEG